MARAGLERVSDWLYGSYTVLYEILYSKILYTITYTCRQAASPYRNVGSRGTCLELVLTPPYTFNMSLGHHHHHARSASRSSRMSSSSSSPNHRPRSPSPPSQTFHPSILPRSVPTPALVESVAGGAHYSGIKVEHDPSKHTTHPSMDRRRSSGEVDVKADHHRVLADLQELYCCRPTQEIFERSWHKDAVFEVSGKTSVLCLR